MTEPGETLSAFKLISLPDDDVYCPERLEKMCAKMDSLDDSWGACYTGYVKHQANGTEQYSSESVEGDVFVQALMRSFYIGTGSNLFFRRSVIEDIVLFDETFKRNQDLEYIVRVLKKYKIAFQMTQSMFCSMPFPSKEWDETCRPYASKIRNVR